MALSINVTPSGTSDTPVTIDERALEEQIRERYEEVHKKCPTPAEVERLMARATAHLKSMLATIVEREIDATVKHAMSIYDAVNLGLLVYAHSPYHSKDDEPFGFRIDFKDVEMEEQPGKWNFRYADHYIKRSLRVPYYYTSSQMKNVAPILATDPFAIRDYFLVGFEGGSGY